MISTSLKGHNLIDDIKSGFPSKRCMGTGQLKNGITLRPEPPWAWRAVAEAECTLVEVENRLGKVESDPGEVENRPGKVESNPGEVGYTLAEVECTPAEEGTPLVELECTPAEEDTPVVDSVHIVEGWE